MEDEKIVYKLKMFNQISLQQNMINPGLGIRSQFLEQFAHFLWAKEQFAREKEQIAPIALLSWATWGNRSQLLFCKEWRERIIKVTLKKKSELAKSDSLLEIKKGKNCQKLIVQVIRSNHERFAQITRKSLTSLMVCSLKWTILSKRTKCKWAKERISNPG